MRSPVPSPRRRAALSRSSAPVELLETRSLLAAGIIPTETTHVAGALLQLAAPQPAPAFAAHLDSVGAMQFDAAGNVGVRITCADVNALLPVVEGLGFRATGAAPELFLMEGFLPVASLPALEGLTTQGLYGVTPIARPVSLRGTADSQGTFGHEAHRQQTFTGGFDGTGVKVGIVSDSYNALGGAAAGVASDDLPAGVDVLFDRDWSDGQPATDAGRAMAEIIHDVAPGANFAFAHGIGGEMAMANNIRELSSQFDTDADVIVDDLLYPTEPMFQDGLIARAITGAVTVDGATYVSAAGDFARQGFEAADNVTFQADSGGVFPGSYLNFNPGGAADTRMRITIPAGRSINLALQWDDPFFTQTGVDTDLGLALVAGNVLVTSADVSNVANRQPVEVLTFTNPVGSTTTQFDIVIQHNAGPVPGRLKFCNYVEPARTGTIQEYGGTSTVVPHAAAANAIGVGAIPWFNPAAPESFSSAGPMTILFDMAGNRLATPEVRQGPHLAAFDGGNTTFFGIDAPQDPDAQPNFFGTSAAAPHLAGIAALVKQASPGLSPLDIKNLLIASAHDVVATGPLYDDVTGFGLVNAWDVLFPTITPVQPNSAEGFENGLGPAWETHATGAGRQRVVTTNGPFAGARHLVLDSSGSAAIPSLSEAILHLDAAGYENVQLMFAQREFNDADDPMPATFSGSSNSDGVALSVDGGATWHRLRSFTGANSLNSYQSTTINLTQAALDAGLFLTSETQIKFQQFGNGAIPNEGIAIDGVQITGDPVFVREGSQLNLFGTPGNDQLALEVDPGIGQLTFSRNNETYFIPLAGVTSLSLDALAGDDEIEIASLLAGLNVTVLGRAGSDALNLETDLDAQLRTANITFDGGADADVLNIDDALDDSGNDVWTLTGTTVKKTTTGTYAHAAVEAVNVQTSQFNNNINVQNLDTPSGTGPQVTITSAGGSDVVRVGTAGQAAVFDGRLEVVNIPASLLAASLTGPGALTFINSTVTVPGALTSAPGAAGGQRLVLQGSTLTGPGTLINQSTLVLEGSALDLRVTNQGTVVDRVFALQLTRPFNNTATGVLRIEGNALVGNVTLSTTAANLTQAGRIELTNDGTGPWNSTLNILSGTFTNTGVIAAKLAGGGDRTLVAAVIRSDAGDFEVDAAQRLTLPDTSITLGSGTQFAGTGDFRIGGNSTLTLPTDLTLPNNSINFEFDNLAAAGAGKIVNNGFLRLYANTANFRLHNAGTLDVRGSSTIANTLTTSPTSRIVVFGDNFFDDALLTVANGFVNRGEIQLTNDTTSFFAAGLTVNAGTLTNSPTGVISTPPASPSVRTISAPTIVNQGFFLGTTAVTGNVTNSGTVSPGNSPGTMTITGNYTQTAAGRFHAELGSAQSDRLNVSGTATLAGELLLSHVPGFHPPSGVVTTIISAGTLVGDFATKNVNPEPGYSYLTQKSVGRYEIISRNSGDLPQISNFGPGITHTEGAAATLLAPGATVTDPNSANFNSGILRVENFGGVESGDVFAIRNEGTAEGQISVVGSAVRYTSGGVFRKIGDISGGASGVSLIVILNSNCTPAAAQALVRNITFRTASDNPGTQTRTVGVTITDGQNASDTVFKTINVVPVNDAPVLGAIPTPQTYAENGAAKPLAPQATLNDADSADFNGGKLTVKYTAGGLGSDRLTIRNQGTAAGQVGVSGSNVTFGGTLIATFVGGTGLQPLVVTFNAAARPGMVLAVLRNVLYQNVSDNPTNFGANPSRTLSYVLTDGDGGTSAAVSQTLNVTAANDAPLIGNFADAATYNRGAGATLLDTNATLADPDSADFAGGNLVLQFTAGGAGTNRLTIRNQGTGANQIGVSGSNVTFAGTVIGTLNANAGVGQTALIVTFTPAATPAGVQALLRNLTYQSTVANPTGPKTLTLKVRDGDGGLTTVNKPLNIAPALTSGLRSTAAFASYAEWESAL